MGTASLLPLCYSCSLRLEPFLSSRTHFPNLNSSLAISASYSDSPTRLRRRAHVAFATNSRDELDESMFMDEDGVVNDMDGYLNYLSPEYESVWDTKPSWCQPWTITLTGVSVIASSWLVLHSIAVTAVVAALICAWWYIFLYSYPKAYTDMIAERRERVKNGVEDTFGFTNSR